MALLTNLPRPGNIPAMLRFDYVPYPLWRRRMPALLRSVVRPLLRRWLAVDADTHPPTTPEAMAAYLLRWCLLDSMTAGEIATRLREFSALPLQSVGDDSAPEAANGVIHLPAQWEPVEAVLLAWPVLYPPLWSLHAQMTGAIAPAAQVVVLVPHPMWAAAARLYLEQRGGVDFDHVQFLHLPTDDIWIRDYGPITGLDAAGEQVAVNAVFDPLPSYPQERDNAMPRRWAAHRALPLRLLNVHLEGGNIWSDGAGTLLISEQVLHANPRVNRQGLLSTLQTVFDVQKVILTPRLEREETGHVDLVVKLADAQTVLVTAPDVIYNGERLRRAADLFRQETNAAGQPYRVLELPAPPLYLNWFVYPIWRSYTNALTVNGRVLVPVFNIPQDEKALVTYQDALPDYTIIPVDCSRSANGGGAVHCLTREIPRQL